MQDIFVNRNLKRIGNCLLGASEADVPSAVCHWQSGKLCSRTPQLSTSCLHAISEATELSSSLHILSGLSRRMTASAVKTGILRKLHDHECPQVVPLCWLKRGQDCGDM